MFSGKLFRNKVSPHPFKISVYLNCVKNLEVLTKGALIPVMLQILRLLFHRSREKNNLKNLLNIIILGAVLDN
jgi:hypothetical protein